MPVRSRRTGKKLRFRYVLLIAGIALAVFFIARFVYSGKYFREGLRLYENNETEKALDRLEKAARLNPWSSEAFAKLSFLYLQKGWFAKAAESAEKAIALKPESEGAIAALGESSFHLARAEESKKNYPEAYRLYRKSAEACRKALVISPAMDTIKYLSTAYLYLGEYDEGIVYFGENLPDNDDAAKERAKLLEIKKRFLAGGGPSGITDPDTDGPLPAGAELAVAGHPIFKFSGSDTEMFQNGVFYSDLDMDGSTELVLIYKISSASGPKSCFVSVFKRSAGRWAVRWNTRLSGSDIGYFTVENINNDTWPDIAVESIYDFKSGAVLNIYSWNGSSYKTLQQIGPTWGTTLQDLDGDGAMEIVILDRKKKEYSSITYKWDGVKYAVLPDK